MTATSGNVRRRAGPGAGRVAGLVALAALAAGCAKRVEPARAAAVKPVRLLAETAERETSRISDVRVDVEFEHSDHGRTAYVVASGETPVLTADGADVRLYGDEAGTLGFTVDNCILIEAVGPDGAVLGRAVVGYTNGLAMGKESVDSLGRRVFAFDAGEVNLAPILPERGPFRLKATVLDDGGVGRVTDVWVHVSARTQTRDDLRE